MGGKHNNFSGSYIIRAVVDSEDPNAAEGWGHQCNTYDDRVNPVFLCIFHLQAFDNYS